MKNKNRKQNAAQSLHDQVHEERCLKRWFTHIDSQINKLPWEARITRDSGRSLFGRVDYYSKASPDIIREVCVRVKNKNRKQNAAQSLHDQVHEERCLKRWFTHIDSQINKLPWEARITRDSGRSLFGRVDYYSKAGKYRIDHYQRIHTPSSSCTG